MRITRLSVRNWKGLTLMEDLAPITVFHGPNWSGKSARLEAIRCALLGYDPALGKRNLDVFQYSSAEECSVVVNFDDATETFREWKRVKNSVKATSTGNLTEGATVPSVLLDPTVYFGLSERERVKMVFEACQIDVDPITELVAVLDKIPVTEQQRPRFLSTKTALVNARLRDQSALDDIVEQWTAWRRESEQQAKGSQGAVGFVAANSEVPDVAKEEAELSRLHGEIEQCVIDLSKARNDVMQAENDSLKRIRAQQELKTNPDKSAELKKLADEVVALTKRPAASQDGIAAAQARLAGIKTEMQFVSDALNSAKERLQALEDESERVLAESYCPTCGATDGIWKKRYRAKIKGERDEINSQIKQHSDRMDALVAEHLRESKREKELTAMLATARESEQRLSQTAREFNLLSQYQERRKEWQATVDAAPMFHVEQCKAALESLQAKLGNLRVREQSFQQTVNSAIAIRGQAALRMQAALKLDSMKADAELAKACLGAAQSVKTRLVEQTFGRLLGIANKLAQPILNRPLAYHDNEVGYWTVDMDSNNPTRRQWVSFKTLSGSEQAITFAAISLALAQDSPIKIVLLDECGRLEKDRKRALLNLLQSLVTDGTIDQAVLADVDGFAYADTKLVKVICTGGQK